MMKNKYRIEFLDDTNSKKTAIVYDYRMKNKDVVIIETENHINPTDYTEIIYNTLKLNSKTIVILDLSNLYGISKDSLYQWIFIEKENKLEDEEFIPINKVNWLEEKYKDSNKLLKKYFLTKTKKLKSMVTV